VTTSISPPIRILALVGLLAAIGVGILLYGQSHASSASSATPPVSHTKTQAKTPHASTPGPVATPNVRPAVTLLPGLPSAIGHALRNSKVVVVSLFSNGAAGDRQALAQARSGASSARVGFAAVNVLDEHAARLLDSFAGATSTPTVLIVRRPGHVVNRFPGYVDSVVVAQAAQNARAGSSH
jgi:hypothetical protein